jgi:hypothetical protein
LFQSRLGRKKFQDFNKCLLIGGYQLQFQYQAGSGPLGVTVDTSYRLADNNWHSVSVERNRWVSDNKKVGNMLSCLIIVGVQAI